MQVVTQTPAIEFDNVYRHFDEEEVLRGLSFQVQEGEIFAFLGRNGTGKTTALRILMGRLAAHHGETRVLGKPSSRFGPADRAQIGYVTEGHQLLPELDLKSTLAFEAGTRCNFQRRFAEEAFGRLGLKLNKNIFKLSRGQRAQVSLILTVASGPRVLVLDDPALGLDVVLRREFLDAMIDFLSGQGTTVLFSSHILTDVERIADRVGILHAGRLCVDAPLAELKQRVRLFEWQHRNGAEPPALPEVLRSERTPSGFAVSLLDPTPAILQRLTVDGARLSEGTTPTLEELFLHLTIDERHTGLLSPLHAASESHA